MAQEVRFLLVEDSEDDTWVLSSTAQRVDDVQLRVVNDGAEAIAYLEGRGEYDDRDRFPLPHIILLDWELPRVSGLEFLMWRHEQASEDIEAIPVVILSGTMDRARVREAVVRGATNFLGKTADRGITQRRLEYLAAWWRETEISKLNSVSLPKPLDSAATAEPMPGG